MTELLCDSAGTVQYALLSESHALTAWHCHMQAQGLDVVSNSCQLLIKPKVHHMAGFISAIPPRVAIRISKNHVHWSIVFAPPGHVVRGCNRGQRLEQGLQRLEHERPPWVCFFRMSVQALSTAAGAGMSTNTLPLRAFAHTIGVSCTLRQPFPSMWLHMSIPALDSTV